MIQLYRLYAWLHRLGIPLLPRFLYMVNRIAFSVALPPTVKVGARTTFAYQGLGVVVHARSVIGDDVYIGPQVIIGGRSGEPAVPVIEDGAFLGAGARILGPITIGKGASVAAGAVVIADVPAGATAAGVPARIIKTGGTAAQDRAA